MAKSTAITFTITITSPEKLPETSISPENPPATHNSPTVINHSLGDGNSLPLNLSIGNLSINERTKDFEEPLEEENQALVEPDDFNIHAVTMGDTPYTSAFKFEDLNLSEELLKGLYVEMRFERPSKIQATTLSMILNSPYKNLIAQAQNGSGKTACFVLGMLSRVDLTQKVPQALCICPTRELVNQDGFKDDSVRIMKDIAKNGAKCQVLLFSATFNDKVKDFVTRTIPDYNQLFVNKEELSLEKVKQYKVLCPDELLKTVVIRDKILDLGQRLGQTIIFARKRDDVDYLYEALVNFGYEVTKIMGTVNSDDRDKIVKEFKDGLTKVLISTDLLARGFDQAQVNLVVNYNLPVKPDNWTEPDYELYLHRVGRAGRFGCNGAVFNLLCADKDIMLMEKIENHFGNRITEVPSYQCDEDFEIALREAGLL